MDPRTQFCHNAACPARGQIGQGNIGVHSQQDQRHKCHICGKTFTATRGTVFYRLRTDAVIVTLVTTLLAWGYPVQAIVAAFGLDERTVRSWQRWAGQHCERLHHHLVEQPRDLGQVQADEIRVKIQAGIIWLASAIQIRPLTTSTLQQAMYLVGTVYNFCTVHQNLCLPIYLPGDRRHWVHRTPAMRLASPITAGRYMNCCPTRCHCRPGDHRNRVGGHQGPHSPSSSGGVTDHGQMRSHLPDRMATILIEKCRNS